MLTIKKLHIKRDSQVKSNWESLLLNANIQPEKTIDYTAGVFDNEKLIATGSIFQNIIKCVAVTNEYSGGSVFNMLITNLMSEIFDRDYISCYVYTKEETAESFTYLGFKEIARVKDKLVFLEKATKGLDNFVEELEKTKLYGEKIAGIVMNANPFTNGHLHLVEKASNENDILHLFVLSEDLSDFPSKIRYELVQKGTKHLKNVILHETGDYMVSAKTFPSYFLKENDDVTYIHASLDALIFKNYIAKALNIKIRYVGEEPLSPATAIYNKALNDVFGMDLQLIVIPRKEILNEVISASRVRKLFKENEMDALKQLVPQSTYEFLNSSKGKEIQKKIIEKDV
jgi:[citrate (pro-3S)-lyase] ligase